jgi:hypothetical protein
VAYIITIIEAAFTWITKSRLPFEASDTELQMGKRQSAEAFSSVWDLTVRDVTVCLP